MRYYSSRRTLLKAAVALAVTAGARASRLYAQSRAALAPTPPDAQGPFFKPGSPRRAALADAGTPGTRLTVAGRVLAPDGTPLPDTKLDFWQTDAHGDYDNDGFRLRGHQHTDRAGRYRLETIVPGAYPGRTRHIHVKVEAPGRPPLTTQLYFPGEPRNRTDFLYKPALAMQLRDAPDGKDATFDFVLR